MGEHRQEFERELEAIEARIIELFAMIAEDLPEATKALLSDDDVVQLLTEREKTIHALYPEIERLADREILLQAPVADDLRFLLSVLRILPEIEQSHDLVVQIASRANHFLTDDLSPRTRGLAERMGNLAADMWRQAADCWYQRDRTAAFALSGRDDEMDELYSSLIADGAPGDDGDDAGGAVLRAAGRPRGQHRPPRGLPGRIRGVRRLQGIRAGLALLPAAHRAMSPAGPGRTALFGTRSPGQTGEEDEPVGI